MILQRKKWMTYTYFNRHPDTKPGTAHLFSFVRRDIPLMKRIPFPTMVVDLHDPDFGETWSKSTRSKIRKAQHESLEVDRGAFLLPAILRLFLPGARLKGLRGYAPEHFHQMPHIECSAIHYEGVMLCGHVWLIDPEEKRALLYVNASNIHHEHEDRSLTGQAHYFLLWQDGLYLRQIGMEMMDLMGYETDPKDPSLKGVYQWKEGTHGRQEILYHYIPWWFHLFRKLRNMLTG